MVEPTHNATANDDEISLAELWAALVRCRYWIAGGAVLFAVIGIVYSLRATPLYTAKTTVVVVDNGGAGGLLSKLPGGLASLAGSLGVVGGGGSNSQTYLAVLGSRELANKFIADQHMLPYLFPGRWDAQSSRWRKVAPGWVHNLIAAIAPGDNEADPNPKPSPWAAYQKFKTIRTINSDSAGGTIAVAFEVRDPDLAAQWANRFVALANKEIRGQVVTEASDALDYLKERARSTSVVGLRETIYRLIEAHLEKITLANVRPEYAFRVIDRAVPPDVRSSPRRKLIVVLAFVLGGVLGGFIGLVREAAVRPSESKEEI